jgi:hypothetical protein
MKALHAKSMDNIHLYPTKSYISLAPAFRDKCKENLVSFLQHVMNTNSKSPLLVEFMTSGIENVPNQDNMQGYLTKRGKTLHTWKSRYYVLNSDSLDYYEYKDGCYLGRIPLKGAKIARQKYTASESSDPKNEFRHAFLIVEADSTHHILCGEDDKDRDEWLEKLLQVLKRSKSPKNQPTVDALAPLPFMKKHATQGKYGIIYQCLDYIEKHGLQEEGIYRISAPKAHVASYKNRFAINGTVDLEGESADVHVIAEFVKGFIRRECPVSVSPEIIELIESPQPDFVRIGEMIKGSFLREILHHLVLVIKKSAVNKLTLRSLSLIFSATLNISAPHLSFLIKHYHQIFQ